MRRATGALTAPLAAPQLVATAAVMCLWALVVREFTAKRAAYFWVSLSTMLLVAIGCSFPVGPSRCAVRVACSYPVAASSIGWFGCRRLARSCDACRSRRAITTAAIAAVAVVDRLVDADANPEQVLQQLTRFRTADGKDAIRGTLVAEFAVGERQTTLYVGFCPPFELLPQVEAERRRTISKPRSNWRRCFTTAPSSKCG